jgi:hypothetical protein
VCLEPVEGFFKEVELLELPPQTGVAGACDVPAARKEVDLRSRGIEAQADARGAGLRPFAQDWDPPEMDVRDEL